MTILKSVAASKVARVGVAFGLAGAVLVGVAGSSEAALSKSSLSPATGAGGTAGSAGSATTKGVTALTGAGFTDAGGTAVLGTAAAAYNTASASGLQFNSAASCPAASASGDGTAVINVTAANYTVVSGTRIVLNVPTLPLGGTALAPVAKAYRLCAYDNTGSSGAAGGLLADALYTVYPQPTVSSVTPAAGALAGGNTVTVVGVNLTAKSTASINGLPLTGVKVAKDLKSLTGVMPATGVVPTIVSRTNPGGNTYDVVVTTEGGPSTHTTGATNNDYKYTNAVTVSPKLAAIGGGTSITVTGKGFNTILNPTNGLPATQAKVFLAKGQYDTTDAASVTASSGAACANVVVVSDTELVCTTPALATGAYIVTLLDDARAASTPATTVYQSVVSSSATITVAAS